MDNHTREGANGPYRAAERLLCYHTQEHTMDLFNTETGCTATDSIGFPCTNSGQPRRYGLVTIILCDDCAAEVRRENKKAQWNNRLRRMSENGLLPRHSLGFCYVILLPDSTVKIGHTGPGNLKGKNDGKLYARWKAISREYKGFITPIGVLEGGETLEGVLHAQWETYRLPGDGERFKPALDLRAWANTLGIAKSADSQVADFRAWQKRNITLFDTWDAVPSFKENSNA